MFYVITGGSGSGKSDYAERLVCETKDRARYYIATMQADDAESRKRIKRHREMRAGRHFTTIECYRDLHKLSLPETGTVLLECMSNLAANEMFAFETEEAQLPELAARIEKKVLCGVEHIRKQTETLVVVTNEIFSDGIHYDPWTRTYQKCLAGINRQMAAQADCVIEVVYGQGYMIKNKNKKGFSI